MYWDAFAYIEQEAAEEIVELYEVWEELRGVEGIITGYLEGTDDFINIRYGDIGVENAGAITARTNTGADILISNTIVRPEGIEATAWILSHELVHGVASALGITGGSLWEEAVAMHVQNRVGKSIGYNPLAWPKWTGLINENPMRRINQMVYGTLNVELSDTVNKVQTAQLLKHMEGYYRQYHKEEKYYPSESYMKQLLTICKVR